MKEAHTLTFHGTMVLNIVEKCPEIILKKKHLQADKIIVYRKLFEVLNWTRWSIRKQPN